MMTGKGLSVNKYCLVYTDTSVVVTDKEVQLRSTDLLYTIELCGEKSKGEFAF